LVVRIVEQKDCSPEQAAITECNSGFYCFDARYLFDALNRVSNRNAQGEFYLTDVIEIARADGRAVVGVKATDVNECLGVNTRVQLAEAARIMQHRINTAHMLAGVTMMDPETVWIGPDVQIAPDVEILPQCMLMGETRVGTGSIIGPNTRLTDVVAGDNCIIDDMVVVEAEIEAGTHLVP
jgi:bifunctional UDP-N-acetylglucosamine pyrophosphorylase/glucosamine-1-phosphate N-acetyltransferase